MNRRYTLALVAAAALVLGSTQLSAHDDKIHKATIGEVTAASADGLSFKTKDGKMELLRSSTPAERPSNSRRSPRTRPR
jgi:hypothetical protein